MPLRYLSYVLYLYKDKKIFIDEVKPGHGSTRPYTFSQPIKSNYLTFTAFKGAAICLKSYFNLLSV